MLVRCYRHSHHSYVTIQDTTVAQTYGWARRGGWRCRCNGARAVPLLTLSWSPGLLVSYILCPVPTPPAPRGVHLLGSWCAGNCTRTCPGKRVSTGRILAEGTGTSGRDCAAATWIRTDSTGWLTALQPLPAMDRSGPPHVDRGYSTGAAWTGVQILRLPRLLECRNGAPSLLHWGGCRPVGCSIGRTGPDWTALNGLHWTGADWADCTALRCTAPKWTALNGLHWTGADGAHCTALH